MYEDKMSKSQKAMYIKTQRRHIQIVTRYIDKFILQLMDARDSLKQHYLFINQYPECKYENRMKHMTLTDLMLMFCDWVAETKKDDYDGKDIWETLNINSKKLNFSDDLLHILQKTVELGYLDTDTGGTDWSKDLNYKITPQGIKVTTGGDKDEV